MVQFRFTFYNDDLAPAGVVVEQPDGWKSARLILERHEKFHCVVKYFEADLLWYGEAASFIRQVISEQGSIGILKCKIEFSEQIGLWEPTPLAFFRMDLSKREGFSKGQYNYKIKIPLIQESEWVKFITRASIPVDVLGLKDMDNNDIAVQNKFTLPLPSQTIKQTLSAYVQSQSLNIRNIDYLVITDPGIPTYSQLEYASFEPDDIIQIDIADIIDLDEVKNRFSIPFAKVETTGKPAYFMTCLYNGNYAFDIRIEASVYSSTAANNGLGTNASRLVELLDSFIAAEGYFDLFFQINEDDPIQFDTETSPLVLTKVSTYYTLSHTATLKQGDSIRIFAKVTADLDGLNDDVPAHPYYPPNGTVLPPLGLGELTTRDNINHLFFWGSDNSNLFIEHYNFTQLTEQSAGVWYYLFGSDPSVSMDAGDPPSGLARPTYLSVIANTTFEDTETDALLIKDALHNILSKITGVEDCLESDLLDSFKGYYAIQKMLHIRGNTMTNKPLFMSFDDWWNGFEPIIPMGLEFIDGKFKVESRAYFYKPEAIINIANIPDIVDSYDNKLFFKSIEVGYIKGQTESASGLDDPQTKRTFRTIIDNTGVDYKQLSTFIAASLSIEQARRNRVEATKDFSTDEDIAIIALRFDGDYIVEIGSDFQVITNLLNSDTRYNVRISAVRNFLRSLANYNGCLVGLPDKKYYFSKGDGNYDMTSQGEPLDSEGDEVVNEKGDINGSSTYQRLPDAYKFNMPMSMTLFNSIEANKNNALGLSRTSGDFIPHFIQRISYGIFEGRADFDMRLTIVGGAQVYRKLEDDTIRELEDGTKRLLE
jgi:hypothetical protein